MGGAPAGMATEAAGAETWPSACSSMLWGILRLVRRKSPEVDDWQTLLEPVEVVTREPPRTKDEFDEFVAKKAEDGLLGTIPNRVIQLAPAAYDMDLHMGFSFEGPAELHAFSFLVEANGKLLGEPCWQNSQAGAPIVPVEDPGDDKLALKLRLNAIPEAAYGCFFCLACFHFSSDPMYYSGGLLYNTNLAVRLATGPREPDLWRYDDPIPPEESCNIWVSAFLYRGPHGRWRLEPLTSKFFIAAVNENAPADAVAEAARSLSWKMGDLSRNRALQSADRALQSAWGAGLR